MRLFKIAGIKAVSLAVAVSLAPATMPAPSAGAPAPIAAIGQMFGTTSAEAGPRYYRGRHFRGHRGYRGHRYRGHRYRHHRRDRGISSGAAAVLGGIVGLGVGAAIASSQQPRYYRAPARRVYAVAPRPYTAAWYRYCASKYRSFDARSGTYQPYHGPRRVCR